MPCSLRPKRQLVIRNKLPKGPIRAFWDKAHKGFGIHWRSLNTTGIILNADAIAGITKPARASMSISIDTLMNAEARAGFAPKGPTGLLGRSPPGLRRSLVYLY